MYNKVKKTITSNFAKVKSLASGAYHQTKKIAGVIDQGVSVMGKVHSAISPLLQDSEIGRQASRAITSGMTEYSKAKGSVQQKHRAVEELGTTVRRAAPELSALF